MDRLLEGAVIGDRVRYRGFRKRIFGTFATVNTGKRPMSFRTIRKLKTIHKVGNDFIFKTDKRL